MRKLKIENIDDEFIDYSKNMFFYTDGYIRKLRLYSVPIDIVEDTFGICHTKYLDVRVKLYRKEKDSQNFVEKVVERIEETDFKKLNKYMKPQKSQKSGFIHILADDENRDVKWGGNEVWTMHPNLLNYYLKTSN